MLKILPSASSSAYTMRLCATAQPRSRAAASTVRVVSIAAAMLPPPNCAGSANPLTKSTISSPYGAFNGSAAPNPWRS
ncbi:Uncharacterised protein [Bordetella pertussis]|nr:Uncharacterised protein [Bordetella pertussis]